MSLYLDASLVVAALVHEPRTADVQDWLERNGDQSFAASDWLLTEFASALGLKMRIGTLDEARRAAASAGLAGLLRGVELAPLDRETFRRAAIFCDRHDLGLRAGDALHLAVCAQRGDMLCTLDRRLAKAGPALGVATQLI